MSARRNFGFAFSLFATCWSLADASAAEPRIGDPRELEPLVARFLDARCASCHSGREPAGGLSLAALPFDPQDLGRWTTLHDRVRDGRMPPADAPQPTPDERRAFVERLGARLHAASLARQRVEGRTVLRRLNRVEYETTLGDLLGRRVDVRDLLPADNVAAGFDNVSAVLDVSSAHLLRYQEAAERALAGVIPRQAPQRVSSSLTGRQVFEKQKQAAGMLDQTLRLDGDVLHLYVRPWNHVSLGTATVPQAGRYRVRALLQAVGTGGRALPVRFTAGWDWGRSERAVRAVRDASAERPTEIEFETELNARELIDVHVWSAPTDREFRERKPATPLKDSPALAIHRLSIEGPLDAWPPVGYVRLFGDVPLQAQYRGGPLSPAPTAPADDARRLLGAFLPLAFRRPVSDALRDEYVRIALDELASKRSFEEAMLSAYRAALCSPHFLFLVEPIGGGGDGALSSSALDPWALAARLSYLLGSTAPDDELRDAAARGDLVRPDELRRHVERLLHDSRAERFTANFAGQWLDLRQIDATTPDPESYGEFDDFLYWSMPRETTRFFEEILRSDRHVREFVHSDWTFLNERLARHYGVPDVHGGELRKVTLPAGAHRGGVLTQAAILKVTADGTKTSPVLRGKWVLERIVGRPPAPPPPGVSAIEPDIRGATTIRQQLDKHRDVESCATCHRHIDPPGFALESFDVIGGWRDFYRGSASSRAPRVELANYPGRRVPRGPDVDASGETPDGRRFANIDEYKSRLLADEDQLVRNVVEKLIVYATGADLQFADREEVERIVERSRADGRGLRSLLHAVVQSRLFRNK